MSRYAWLNEILKGKVDYRKVIRPKAIRIQFPKGSKPGYRCPECGKRTENFNQHWGRKHEPSKEQSIISHIEKAIKDSWHSTLALNDKNVDVVSESDLREKLLGEKGQDE